MLTIVSRCKLHIVRTQHHKLENLKSPKVMVDCTGFHRNASEVLNLFNLVTRLKILASIVYNDVKPHMFAFHNGISFTCNSQAPTKESW